MKDEEQYLWDGTGTVDPDVRALEELLRPLGADHGKVPVPVVPLLRESRAPSPVAMRKRYFAAAAILLLSGLAYWSIASGTWTARSIELRVVGLGRVLRPGTLFVASKEANVLRLGKDGRFGELTLDVGSRIRVGQLTAKQIVLSLERGRLDALVSADAKPGFFNVDTPATRCVDLGCAFELEVDAEGNAFVHVRSGRVAFRDGPNREVFIPAGAVCRATKDRGAGTPRFADSTQAKTLDAFDAATDPIVRLSLAKTIMSKVLLEEDLLPVWHFMQENEANIAIAASQFLRKRYGALSGLTAAVEERPTEKDRATWREKLWPDRYR